jgi:hypothetical protein
VGGEDLAEAGGQFVLAVGAASLNDEVKALKCDRTVCTGTPREVARSGAQNGVSSFKGMSLRFGVTQCGAASCLPVMNLWIAFSLGITPCLER